MHAQFGGVVFEREDIRGLVATEWTGIKPHGNMSVAVPSHAHPMKGNGAMECQ